MISYLKPVKLPSGSLTIYFNREKLRRKIKKPHITCFSNQMNVTFFFFYYTHVSEKNYRNGNKKRKCGIN